MQRLCCVVSYVGLSDTYTVENLFVKDSKKLPGSQEKDPEKQVFYAVGGENVLTSEEFDKLIVLDPEDGPAAFHAVITWALNDVVARTSNAAVSYPKNSQVLQEAIKVGTQAKPEPDVRQDLKKHLDQKYITKKEECPIEEWDVDDVACWIDGLKGVNDIEDDNNEFVRLPKEGPYDPRGGGSDEHATIATTRTVGACFRYNDVKGSELLTLSSQEVMAMLKDGCAADAEAGAVGKYKLVMRTKRIMDSIEQVKKVRGDSYSLSEARAGQLITSILQLRQKLASLYGFNDQ